MLFGFGNAVDEKKLVTRVYIKPINSYLYLDGTLCHPIKIIDLI